MIDTTKDSALNAAGRFGRLSGLEWSAIVGGDDTGHSERHPASRFRTRT